MKCCALLTKNTGSRIVVYTVYTIHVFVFVNFSGSDASFDQSDWDGNGHSRAA